MSRKVKGYLVCLPLLLGLGITIWVLLPFYVGLPLAILLAVVITNLWEEWEHKGVN